MHTSVTCWDSQSHTNISALSVYSRVTYTHTLAQRTCNQHTRTNPRDTHKHTHMHTHIVPNLLTTQQSHVNNHAQFHTLLPHANTHTHTHTHTHQLWYLQQMQRIPRCKRQLWTRTWRWIWFFHTHTLCLWDASIIVWSSVLFEYEWMRVCTCYLFVCVCMTHVHEHTFATHTGFICGMGKLAQ